MNVGDLVKSKFQDELNPWTGRVVLITGIEPMAGTDGAWVEWPGKGLYWSPTHQLEIVSEARRFSGGSSDVG